MIYWNLQAKFASLAPIIIELTTFMVRSGTPASQWVQGMFALTITTKPITIITIIITVILSFSLQT